MIPIESQYYISPALLPALRLYIFCETLHMYKYTVRAIMQYGLRAHTCIRNHADAYDKCLEGRAQPMYVHVITRDAKLVKG